MMTYNVFCKSMMTLVLVLWYYGMPEVGYLPYNGTIWEHIFWPLSLPTCGTLLETCTCCGISPTGSTCVSRMGWPCFAHSCPYFPDYGTFCPSVKRRTRWPPAASRECFAP